MSNSVIQLSVQTDLSYSAGELRDPVSRATIEFFDSYEPSAASSRIAFSSADGLDPKEFSSAPSLGFGELRSISQACVSDVSVFESSSSLASVDPALLANADSAGILNTMNEQVSFEALNSELLDVMPRVKHALDGELSHSELTQLIADIQAQVLDLNTLSQDVFGELSNEVNNAVQEVSAFDVDSLLTSMQIDSGLFAQPELAGSSHSLAFAATLDALFTSPEAFPLTLDFSSPNSIQEASELFASAGGASSISSTASNADVDGGLPTSGPGSSDLG
ncbi:hypothetical protein [Limnobacter sp. 130]|uniref:hypothetical protein n=1 Tax=unclassified Limnobacter TaxID=2630203 RepID=UPI0012EF8D90|nr:hypothetical protein [Limnobacter sp. 130]VWX33976.1 conserved hypothetical protein [Limnobacter sp. 130]